MLKVHKSGHSRGVTLVETMLAVILISLLFGAANSVLSYSRRETAKGFWIQQGITQLRNGTRAITDMLKKTSYPTTVVRSGGNETVISFKEMREYDETGRLREMSINDSKAYDMHTISDGNMIRPNFNAQTIMYFPACEPEKDLDSGYTPGVINWVELVLKPGDDYSTSGLGTLHIIERKKEYDTRGDPDRVYGLSSGFDDSIPISRSREVIKDVNAVEVNTFEIEELRGLVVTKDGNKYPVTNKRILVTINITVSHPKDNRIWLSDQCSVINNVQVVKFDGGEYLELMDVYSTSSGGIGGSALVKYRTNDLPVSCGSSIGSYRVTAIYSDSLAMKEPGSDVERLLVKRPD